MDAQENVVYNCTLTTCVLVYDSRSCEPKKLDRLLFQNR
jgi:hypothetical protein